MTHSSRRMPRALCDGRAGGRRAMGLRRGRAHANAKEGETNRGRAAKKRTRRGQTAQGARGAWPMPRQRAKEAETATANRARGPRRLRATRGRHAQRRRIGALFAAERRARGCRRFRIESASNPHRCRHAAGPCRTRRATDATRRVTFRRTRRARRDDASDARRDPGRLHRSDSNVERTPHGRGLTRRAFRARREQCSPRRHERAFQTSVRRARRGPSAAPGRFSPRSAIRPSA